MNRNGKGKLKKNVEVEVEKFNLYEKSHSVSTGVKQSQYGTSLTTTAGGLSLSLKVEA